MHSRRCVAPAAARTICAREDLTIFDRSLFRLPLSAAKPLTALMNTALDARTLTAEPFRFAA